jgi:hypothetical protein
MNQKHNLIINNYFKLYLNYNLLDKYYKKQVVTKNRYMIF